MTWESISLSRRLFTGVEEVDRLLDSQRRFISMLDDGDIFYSRIDLRMFIDKCRDNARSKILEVYTETHGIHPETSQELVLHAAAELKVSPQNITQLIRDYPDLIHQTYPKGPNGSLPLHLVSSAVGLDHLERLKPFLSAYPDGVRRYDKNGVLPIQIALVYGADFDVIKLLIDSFPPVLACPFLPLVRVSEDLNQLVGLLPFHIACCRNYSLNVIFQLLLGRPDCVIKANNPLDSHNGKTPFRIHNQSDY